MIKVSKGERIALEEVGLLHHAKTGAHPQDQNFTVANKNHGSKAKNYYVTESVQILGFLGRYEQMDLIRIRKEQAESLVQANLIRPDQIQHVGTVASNPVVFVDNDNNYRMRKIFKFIGFLKANQKKN